MTAFLSGSSRGSGAATSRFLTVFASDLAYLASRPMIVIWALVLIVSAWGMSSGSMRIQSGDASVGGTKAFITSEFALGMQIAVLTALFSTFFASVAAGTTIIRDEEWRLGELLHATPLRPGEYIWAKFAAVLVGSVSILAIQIAAMMFFYHVVPGGEAQEFRGPFASGNYLRPTLLFALPTLVFITGASFAVGEWSRRSIPVYLLPVTLLMVDLFFLWSWSPGWLDPRLNAILMALDPSGFRWLSETWLKVDRGVAFYNTARMPVDAGFLLSRVIFAGAGVGAVAFSRRHFGAGLRGRSTGSLRRRTRPAERVHENLQASPVGVHAKAPVAKLASLRMSMRRPGLLVGARDVARVELVELRSSPGLYLFAPLILLQVLSTSLFRVSFLDAPQLVTPGGFAVSSLSVLSVCVCLLLLFYTVDSLDRERSTRLAPISYAASIRTGSLLLGKAVAQAVVAMVIVLAAFVAGLIAILIQGKVRFELSPFVLVWGLLLLPTFLLWTSFVTAVWALTRSRYNTYSVGLATLCFTGYRLFTGEVNWVGNWPLWDAVRWSDISVLELDRRALILNRVFALGLTGLFVAIACRAFRRAEPDPVRTIHRLRPASWWRSALRLAPFALAPIIAGTWLAMEVYRGHQGGPAMKRAKDYWRKNLATYRDAPIPDITHVDLELELFPSEGRYKASGAYDLVNPSERPLRDLLLTTGDHWEKLGWTRDGATAKPTDRAGLAVFPTDPPLARGKSTRIGFRHEGALPRGISRRQLEASEFILPSGVVLTSFRPTIVPVPGFIEDVGVEEENRAEPREYPDDYFEGPTASFLGARRPFTTRIKITGPADFTLNSVGTMVEESTSGGRRTVIWESDHPVSFFNIVAGKWEVKRGRGTAVFYDAAHAYNVDSMLTGLDAARTYYSRWFYPFPWKELKLSEFPNLASYAQGFPTNITFSEGIGFLTKSSAENDVAFEITGHEAAHQWWGNILSPGKGPGAVVLAEGMAHFSTILLVEQVKGPAARIDFCKRLEDKYAKERQADSERPLVKVDGSRPGDTSVIYDRGGWVMWMLARQIGRERLLEGLRAFIRKYEGNPDHPVLQDLLAGLRESAPDGGAFDAFARQWFHQTVLPEYRLHQPARTRTGETWEVTVWVENVGSGRMPVEIAATRGDRPGKDGAGSADYHDSRTSLILGKGETRSVSIPCRFEPDRIVVDPDANVLQLRRKEAISKF